MPPPKILVHCGCVGSITVKTTNGETINFVLVPGHHNTEWLLSSGCDTPQFNLTPPS